MKKMRKLIPALAMLLVSAVMMSTASFAWFSMNTTVTADGMSITAKNDSKYLQIIKAGDSFDNEAAQTSATAVNASNEVRPVTIVNSLESDKKTVVPYDGNTAPVWVEAFSASPDQSEMRENSEYKVVSNLEGHALVNTFKVRMNPATGVDEGEDLYVSGVTVTATDSEKAALKDAIRVAFVGTDFGVIFDADGNKVGGTDDDSAIIIDTVDDVGVEFSVYIFIDGEDDAATTNNAALDSGYTVEFSLSIK